MRRGLTDPLLAQDDVKISAIQMVMETEMEMEIEVEMKGRDV